MLSKSEQRMMADARWKAYFSRQSTELARTKATAARGKAYQAACEPGQPVVPVRPLDKLPSMSGYFPSSLNGRRVVLTRGELANRSRRAQRHEFSAAGQEGMAKAQERAARKIDPSPLYSPTDRPTIAVTPAGKEQVLVAPWLVANTYLSAAQYWQAAKRDWDEAASIWWPSG